MPFYTKMMSSKPMNYIKTLSPALGLATGVGAGFGAARGYDGDRSMGGRMRGMLGGAAAGAVGYGAVAAYNNPTVRGMINHPGLLKNTRPYKVAGGMYRHPGIVGDLVKSLFKKA